MSTKFSTCDYETIVSLLERMPILKEVGHAKIEEVSRYHGGLVLEFSKYPNHNMTIKHELARKLRCDSHEQAIFISSEYELVLDSYKNIRIYGWQNGVQRILNISAEDTLALFEHNLKRSKTKKIKISLVCFAGIVWDIAGFGM